MHTHQQYLLALPNVLLEVLHSEYHIIRMMLKNILHLLQLTEFVPF